MCTRARYLPVNASVLLPLGRAVRDKGSGCVQFLKSNPFLPNFSKPTWHCGDYKEGQNLNCLQGIENVAFSMLLCNRNESQCPLKYIKQKEKGLMLLLKLENYLITYLKWPLNTKQKQNKILTSEHLH